MRRYLICALLVLLSVSGRAADARRTGNVPVLYELTRDGAKDTSYLFGTLHLLESSYVDTMSGVMRALSGSDLVIGEIALVGADTSDVPGAAGGVLAEALKAMMSGPRLDSVLTPEQYKRVSATVLRLAHLPIQLMGRLSPVILSALLLEQLYTTAHAEDHVSGIPMDLYFQREAVRRGLTVRGLEAATDQADLLSDSIPMPEQVKELLDLVDHEKEATASLEKMLRRYERGEIDGLIEDPEFGAFSDRESRALIYDRNTRWLKELREILPGHRAFIAVGAGHLPGEKGLLAGLRTMAYHVRRVR